MKYFAAAVVLLVLAWPIIIWVYDREFTDAVLAAFLWIWGLAAIAVIITKIQGKKLW